MREKDGDDGDKEEGPHTRSSIKVAMSSFWLFYYTVSAD